MRAHQLADVERREPVEHAVPDQRDQRRRDQQLRKARERVARQFAARRRAAHDRAQRRGHALDHLVIVELGELREPRAFGDDQPDHVLAAGAEDLAHEKVGDGFRDDARRQVGDLRGLDGADHRAQRRAHELLEQALLVAEVEIDRALGDAGAPGDVIEAGRGEA